MGYLLIEDFRLGVDRTRPIYAAKPGALWQGINGHLSKGGDFEARKAFVKKFSAPANTYGLQAGPTGALYVFGNLSPGAVDVPLPLFYERIEHPTDPTQALVEVLSSHLFDGQKYVVGQFANGDIRHFIDGTNVADWNAGGANNPPAQNAIPRNTRAHFAMTHGQKVHAPTSTGLLYFSGVDSGVEWTAGGSPAGAGFFGPATHAEGSTEIAALAPYQQTKLVIMSRNTTQLWTISNTPANNAPYQTIENVGCIARRSVVQIGDVDVIFLGDSGIRSLKARENINYAAVVDIGTPVDELVTAELAAFVETGAVGDDWIPQRAASIVEKVGEHVLMAVGYKIFVYSYHPGAKVAGWTWYEPGFVVDRFANSKTRLWLRSLAGSKVPGGDATDLWGSIYLYGGDSGNEYDTSPVTCWLPFLNGGKPGHRRDITGVDIAAKGGWRVEFLINPRNETDIVHGGRAEGVTYNLEDVGMLGATTHVSVRLTREEASAASVSNVAIHWEGGDSE